MEKILVGLNLLVLLGTIASYFLLRYTLTSYATEKGKNIATKEDVSEITRLIESTKLLLQQRDRYEAKKYELKYKACLNLLRIVDAQLSHVVVSTDNHGNAIEIDKQSVSAEEIRTCHNELILALDDSQIINIFLTIMTGGSSKPIVELDELRSLIRSELGFDGVAYADAEKTWIGGKSPQKSEV